MRIRRDGLSSSYRHTSSKACRRLLYHSDLFQDAEWIFTYYSFGSELDTVDIILEALHLGKRVAVPRVEGKGMAFREILSLNDCRPGIWGIQEPDVAVTAPVSGSVALMSPSLMFIPGLAFDQNGYRLGYGGGYYDKYLSDHKGFVKTGLAFPEQIIDKIPYDKYDQQVDYIFSSDSMIEIK